MGQYEPNGIGEMRKKKKEIWKPSECCAVYTRTYHIWCTHIGALWMGFSVWFVFRKMPGKRKRNYPHNTTNRVRCMRNANVLLFSVFMCGFFFLCRSRAWARLQAQNASPQSTQFGKSQRNACIAWIYVYRRSRWRGGVLGVSMAIGKSWWCLYDCYTNGSDNISTVHTQCILPWTSPSSIDPG